LECILADWADFLFVSNPGLIAVYADHDEYTTFYVPEKEALLTLTTDLEKAGFQPLRDYIRHLW
jgi:hypothetical protein